MREFHKTNQIETFSIQLDELRVGLMVGNSELSLMREWNEGGKMCGRSINREN